MGVPTVRFVKTSCVAAAAVAALLWNPSTSAAAVQGEIAGPGAMQTPIAVPQLKWLGGPKQPRAADEFTSLLAADLERSGLFRLINAKAYIEDPQASGITRDTINFDNWLVIDALGLVRGGYKSSAEGISIEVRFFDTATRSSMGGSRFSGSIKEVPLMAHKMADAILGFVTGKKGPFASMITFVSDRHDRFREIYTYGFDGGVRRVTRHRSITMAPSWHPRGDYILFTSFRGGKPGLYDLNLATSSDSRIATKFGVNVGGTYSPDGRHILLSRERGGNTDIYVIDMSRQKISPLTSHWGIDVEPAWSPDGKRIAFCSSRAGSPQIYTMKADGSDIRRLTFEGDYNCSPDWSPDGRMIAYAGREGGRFQIFTVPAGGGKSRRVTGEGSNEDPTWSPDSRYIAFSRRVGGKSKIFMTDVSGRWTRQLTHGNGNDRSPNWSGRLE